jgi:hypothetical protein
MGNRHLRKVSIDEQSGRRQDTYSGLNFSLKISHSFGMVVKVIIVELRMQCGVNGPDLLSW